MSLLRFDKFMHHALYHPTEGYYSNKIAQVGYQGDFSTSVTLSNTLAHSIVKWILSEIKFHNLKSIHLIEIGAGNGQLASDIYRELPFLLRRKIILHIVETSAPLRKLQQQKLKKIATWHSSPQEALIASEGNALVYSNELVDAFPVRIFQTTNSEVTELYINTKSRVEHFAKAEYTPYSTYFNKLKKDHLRFEVHDSYRQWVAEWIRHLKKGSMLTIDYGAKVEDQLRQKPKGSLRGYYKHQKIEGNAIYHNIGHQDLTSDVNFSDLILWGEEHEIETVSLIDQHDFLIDTKTNVTRFLSDKDGAGSAFKVLHQRKK